jgi:hypothetical protein
VAEGLAACCYCNLLVRVKGVRPDPLPGEWTLPAGRFAGKTLAEAAAEPNGVRYLQVLRDTDQTMAPMIEAFLSTVTAQ